MELSQARACRPSVSVEKQPPWSRGQAPPFPSTRPMQTTSSPDRGTSGSCFQDDTCPLPETDQHHRNWATPVASKVDVGSKAMLATGAVCTAFHVRLHVSDGQFHCCRSSDWEAVTRVWGKKKTRGPLNV